MEMDEYGPKFPCFQRIPIYRDPTYRGCAIAIYVTCSILMETNSLNYFGHIDKHVDRI